MVDRYAPKEYRQGLCLDEDGGYVRYSDYATLEEKLAKVRERAQEAAAMCEAGYPVSGFNLILSALLP